jgi:glycosyltransferase involved in cell wall biosynthesis
VTEDFSMPHEDPSIDLLVPAIDTSDPEVTIVIPASNEEITISETVDWCIEGLATAGVCGEVLIVDSSTDRTCARALEHGARVLRTPKRGLGRAYIDAIPFIRGRFVIMGDADCTYDFRYLAPFVEKMREGSDFVMGSRWMGSIAPGAMPALHRYFGTPLTTGILNVVYGSKFTDIHCGMRAVTLEALKRMGLVSQSWEYASEMILKSVRMEMQTSEVPVVFHKDREGRVSHYKRTGWYTPFYAAWISWRIQFVYRADFFMMGPGLAFLILGALITLPLSVGPISIGSVTFNLYWMLLGVTLTVLGLESFYFGCLAQVFCDYSGKARARWIRLFRYTRSVLASAAIFGAGLIMTIVLASWYLTHGHRLPLPNSAIEHLAVLGLLLMIVGFSTFCFTLLLYATGVRYGRRADALQQPVNS